MKYKWQFDDNDLENLIDEIMAEIDRKYANFRKSVKSSICREFAIFHSKTKGKVRYEKGDILYGKEEDEF